MNTEEFKIDTAAHRAKVMVLMLKLTNILISTSYKHDLSKDEEPEVSEYPKHISALKSVEYQSPEYRAITNGPMHDIIQVHYSKNRHHPQHFPNGVAGMNLIDVMEMLCDWVAASSRNPNGSPENSLMLNVERFNITPELESILRNTLELLKE